ncbi:MAG: methyltransferase domain-containing protein, partial [Victivallales bacterium]|nr:methyltransferase domain-containing protein [Victivallales bacterium]
MEFRRIFDTIPEKFDKYRVHYSPDLFVKFIGMAHITPSSSVLELGPGTGQATDPILDTGCDYNAIEIGDNFCGVLNRKYGSRKNFTLIHDDFITHDFGDKRFDAIYSA